MGSGPPVRWPSEEPVLKVQLRSKIAALGSKWQDIEDILTGDFFGVLDYLRVADLRDAGGSPVDVILSSPALLFCGIGWALATLWSVGIF